MRSDHPPVVDPDVVHDFSQLLDYNSRRPSPLIACVDLGVYGVLRLEQSGLS